jgi:two-component system phosphate regulon response regulator PhoB/two-component system alkaline phosphatase synthesis response regulator PhoP/two-component system response regulator VicR
MGARADILIIEDDRDLVNSLRIILESKDYTVRAAYNGKEGYAKIEEKIPDLTILDVMMATDTEGFDLAFKLRDNPQYKNIPIVMVTGFPQKMAKEGPEKFQHIMGESWPVSHILEKPIDPDELVSIVQAFLKEAGKG